MNDKQSLPQFAFDHVITGPEVKRASHSQRTAQLPLHLLQIVKALPELNRIIAWNVSNDLLQIEAGKAK